MAIKIWGIVEGPISIEELPDEDYVPSDIGYFLVCKTEIDGKIEEANFWFEEFDDAYEWETHFKKSIEPIVIDMGNGPEYN